MNEQEGQISSDLMRWLEFAVQRGAKPGLAAIMLRARGPAGEVS